MPSNSAKDKTQNLHLIRGASSSATTSILPPGPIEPLSLRPVKRRGRPSWTSIGDNRGRGVIFGLPKRENPSMNVDYATGRRIESIFA